MMKVIISILYFVIWICVNFELGLSYKTSSFWLVQLLFAIIYYTGYEKARRSNKK